jgi:hypothetical protein
MLVAQVFAPVELAEAAVSVALEVLIINVVMLLVGGTVTLAIQRKLRASSALPHPTPDR